MGQTRFKSLDDFTKYAKEHNLIEEQSANNRKNNKEKKSHPQNVDNSRKKREKCKKQNSVVFKSNAHKRNVDKESFSYYKGLSIREKKNWFKKRGIEHFVIKGRYNSVLRKLFTDVINPFTNRFIEVPFSDRTLENGSILYIELMVIPQPRNRDVIFNYLIHKPSNKSKVSANFNQKKKSELNEENVVAIQPIKRTEKSAIKSNVADYKKIHFDDFVTTTDSNSCTKNKHDIEEIDAVVFVLRKSGKIIEKMVPASYCRTCKRYYISRWQYENICELGTPLWQNISEYGGHHAETHSYYDELNAESILHRSGYNVGSEDDLTAEQRHTILTLLVESKLCDKHKIVSHLTWLINSRQGNKSMQNAVGKWKEDRNFIDSYHLGTHRIVGISVIRHRV